jgi:hypothetical protein
VIVGGSHTGAPNAIRAECVSSGGVTSRFVTVGHGACDDPGTAWNAIVSSIADALSPGWSVTCGPFALARVAWKICAPLASSAATPGQPTTKHAAEPVFFMMIGRCEIPGAPGGRAAPRLMARSLSVHSGVEPCPWPWP